MPRTHPDHVWAMVRAEREMGMPFKELAKRYGLSETALRQRAAVEGWGDGSHITDIIRQRVMEQVLGIEPGDPQRVAAQVEAAAKHGADLLRKHREEWEEHRARFGIPQDFETGKLAKISAEMLRIRQDGERRAWGLDVEQQQSVTTSIDVVWRVIHASREDVESDKNIIDGDAKSVGYEEGNSN